MYNNKSEGDLILTYAKQVQKAFPKRPDSYKLLGQAWGNKYSLTKSQVAFDNAIANKRRYQKLSPATLPYGTPIEWNIKGLEKFHEENKKAGKVKP